MSVALISLSKQGAAVAQALARGLAPAAEPGHLTTLCTLYLHASVDPSIPGQRFERVADLAPKIFRQYRGLVFVMPCGVVVRAIAPCLEHKKVDPAVVVVDVGGRFAVSLLSGHEGGANDLALQVANAIAAEPVISTTTEALKTVIIGIGCRRGTEAERIVAAVHQTLARVSRELSEVRLLASADIKSNEPGLIEAARQLGLPLRFIASSDIRACRRDFAHSVLAQQRVGLPAVAEPVALLAGRRTRLLLQRQTFKGITTAVAGEDCAWSASAPAVPTSAPDGPNEPSPTAR